MVLFLMLIYLRDFKNKKYPKWTYSQSRNKLTDLENKLMVAKGEGGGERIIREFGIDMYTLIYLMWVTNKVPLYTQGNLLNVMWQPEWKGRLRENGYTYVYGRVPLLSIWNYYDIVNWLCCSVAQSCPTLFDPMDCSTQGLPVLHCWGPLMDRNLVVRSWW